MASPTIIPHFLKARTPGGLRRLMLRNNIKRQMIFDYQIIHDGQQWFAWFQDDVFHTQKENIAQAEVETTVNKKD